ncbi:MAG: protoporphyrinogen/coproporphyrinogen oxidase [Pseudobdellovibrionaceae bacterium]
MSVESKKKVSVIGGGFAGLTISLRLAQKGFEVDLFESSNRVGGLLGTDRTEHGIAERAANALICTESSTALFTELDLAPSIPLKSAKKRFLFRKKPRVWPLNLFETLGFITKIFPSLLKGKKSFAPLPTETLQNWGLRKLGPAATRYILGPAMQGIYGNEISGLSASLILGPLFSKRKSGKYKGLLTGPGGMQDLIDHLERKIIDLGVRIHLNSSIRPENISGPLVIATSAQAASSLLKNREPSTASLLEQIKMSSLISATIFFKETQKKFQGFGCLIPRGYSIKSLGVLINSYIFKDRNKVYNETWMLGGIKEGALLDLSDQQLIELILRERRRIFDIEETPLDYRINRWRNALPYYDINLEKVVDEIRKNKTIPANNVYLHGNYLNGIGLSKILEQSNLLAEIIASHHG